MSNLPWMLDTQNAVESVQKVMLFRMMLMIDACNYY